MDNINLNEVINEELGKKKKRGRPKKIKVEEEKIPDKTIDIFNDTFNIPLSMVFDIFLSRLKLSPLNEIERQNLDKSFNIVLAKYISEIKFKEEINLLIVISLISSTRYLEYKETMKKENEKEKINNEGSEES